MTVMASIQERPPTPEEKRAFFHKKMLERVRSKIGLDGIDKDLKEYILPQVAAKMTSIHIGCLDQIEQFFGAEMWGYKVPEETFNGLSFEEQQTLKRRARTWEHCRGIIKSGGDKAIDSVIDILSEIIFLSQGEYDELQKSISDLEEKLTALEKENKNERK